MGPTPGGGLSTEPDTGADTAEGEMRSGGSSGAPGDRGGGDGRVMEDVMCSDPGHQPIRRPLWSARGRARSYLQYPCLQPLKLMMQLCGNPALLEFAERD